MESIPISMIIGAFLVGIFLYIVGYCTGQNDIYDRKVENLRNKKGG